MFTIYNNPNSLYPKEPYHQTLQAHSLKASEIETEIQALREATANTSSTLFKEKIAEIKNRLAEEKESCINHLSRLNGDFFEDPKSTLKQAWDRAVNDARKDLNKNLETRDQLDTLSTELQGDATQKAASSINFYKALEEERDSVELRLNEVLSLQKTDPETSLSIDTLKQRQKELCGDYYEDPNGLLDQAWKKYQTALINNNELVTESFNTYNRLETERKNNEILIKKLESISFFTPKRTIEMLTQEKIQEKIVELESDKKNEINLSFFSHHAEKK